MSQEVEPEEEPVRRAHGLVLCPRCRQFGWAYVKKIRDRKYVYVLHRIGNKNKHCYLGPLDTYKNTFVTNQIPLKGLLDQLRYVKYLRMVLKKIAEQRVEKKEDKENIVQQLKEAKNELENIIKRFESELAQETGQTN